MAIIFLIVALAQLVVAIITLAVMFHASK